MWLDEDPLTDPTVHVPFLVHLRYRDGRTLDAGATYARLDGAVLLFEDAHQSGRHVVDLGDLVSGEVAIRPRPDDFARLRTEFPSAYAPWHSHDLEDLVTWRRVGDPSLAEVARRLRRPPEHVETKAERLVELARAVRRPPRTEPAPYHDGADDDGPYVVVVHRPAHPADVAARAGVTPVVVFLSILNAFSAPLTTEQRDALRQDPDVDYIDAGGEAQLRATEGR
jgi:hypothetical protein